MKAELAGKSILIAFDTNSKLGIEFIPQDTNIKSPKGKILSGILEHHALTVVNGITNKCSGVITRQRNTKYGVKKV